MRVNTFCDNVRNLSLVIDSNLSWAPHNNTISNRMHFSYHSLRHLQYFLPHKTKTRYADVCYLDVIEELLNKLVRL